MKFAIWTMAAAVGLSVFGTEDLELDGKFRELNGDKPAKWQQNQGEWNKPWGEVSVRKEGDEARIAIKSTAKNTQMFTHTRTYDAKEGELFEVKVSARGKGAVEFGIYVYSDNGKTIGVFGESEKLGADFADYTAVIPVESKPGMTPAKARIYFGAAPDSQIEVREIAARKVDKGAVKLKFNDSFSAKAGAVEPDAWKMNNNKWNEPWGKLTMNGGDFPVTITASTVPSQLFTSGFRTATAPGRKITLSAVAKGRGELQFGIYLYDKDNKSLGIFPFVTPVTSEAATYSHTFEVAPVKDAIPAYARLFVGAAANAEISFASLRATAE